MVALDENNKPVIIKKMDKVPYEGKIVNSTTNSTNGTFVVTLSVPEDGEYNITATTYDNASNSNISYQNDSVVKWGWSNVTWDLPPDGNSYTVGETITLTCFVRDANTSSAIESYPVHFCNVTADDTSPGAVSSGTTLKSWGEYKDSGVTVSVGTYKDLYLAYELKGSGTGTSTVSVLGEAV